MDFMKVFDQTVRDIKREVNLRVLKVPEIEQKVLDATSNEPWGPHGADLSELARETKKFSQCELIMNVLWTRLSETGANWRHVYKALTIIEYLLANGSERAVDEIIEHSFKIASLSSFEYVEPNLKDMGINVRKKSETISDLLTDREKIKAVREKAATTRDKYFGLSSSGVTNMSSSGSINSSSFGGGYGGFSDSKGGEMYKDSYTDYADIHEKRKDRNATYNGRNISKKETTRRSREQSSSNSSKALTDQNPLGSSVKNFGKDDFDDFNPRGLSTTESAPASVKQVDLFGDSLIGDLMDAPTSFPTEPTHNAPTEVDLFADASFISAPPNAAVPADFHVQDNVDLFGNQSDSPASFPTKMDPFAIPIPKAPMVSSPTNTFSFNDPLVAKPPHSGTTNDNSFDPFAVNPLQSDPISAESFDPFVVKSPQSDLTSARSFDPFSVKPSESSTTDAKIVDPFSTVPINSFEESDVFGEFSSNNNTINSKSSQKPVNDVIGNPNQNGSSKLQTKKDHFQVKSGIWADSLSRGLIDLNIAAPKTTSLSVGVLSGLGDISDEKEKSGLSSSFYMGRAMGTGKGLGTSGFPSMETGSGVGSSFLDLGQQEEFSSFK